MLNIFYGHEEKKDGSSTRSKKQISRGYNWPTITARRKTNISARSGKRWVNPLWVDQTGCFRKSSAESKLASKLTIAISHESLVPGSDDWRSIENDGVSVVLVVHAHSLATARRTSE